MVTASLSMASVIATFGNCLYHRHMSVHPSRSVRAITMMAGLVISTFLSAQDVTHVYDLGKPQRVLELDESLRELSGLACFNDQFCAIQDEKGKVYFLDAQTGAILHDEKFWDKGDYEDIEIVGERVFVIKSNGNIYESNVYTIDEDATIKYDLGFSSDWNFEGMTYDPVDQVLLICAKRKTSSSRKEIYSLPINDLYTVGKPRFVLNQTAMKNELDKAVDSWSERLVANISDLTYSFNPSAIAIHPIDDEIYVLSSPIPQLAIFTRDWKLRKIFPLDPSMYKQPESMCFDSSGTLYIGNEGRGGKATIFKMVPK